MATDAARNPDPGGPQVVDDGLLAILACPVPECRAPLSRTPAGAALRCTACGLEYPIRERWVVLIPEEARQPDGVAR